MGSSLIGTSPEFEVALYTIVFLCSKSGENIIRFGGQDVIVTIYRHGNNLGCAFPKHYK